MSDFVSLATCPFPRMSQVSRINKSEFIAVASTKYSDGIYKYNINNDKWTKIISYEEGFVSTTPSAAFDELNGLIYICNQQHQILQFNINTKTMKILLESIVVRTDLIGSWTNMICVKDALHILSTNNKHVIFNGNDSFDEIHQFDTDYYKFLANFVYLKSKRTLILFNAKAEEMYEYETWNNKWITYKLNDFKPLKDLQDSAIVCCENEEWVVIIGGWTGQLFVESRCDSILLFNTKKKTFVESKIKCPFGACGYEAVIMRDEYKDELLVFGFINGCYTSNAFTNVRTLPFYIMKLINKWVCNEWIYFISWKKGDHCKIHLDAII